MEEVIIQDSPVSNAILKGIHMSRIRTRDLDKSYGEEIVADYRAGRSLDWLAREYSPDYDASRRVAVNSIYGVLVNRLSRDERIKLGKEHRKATGKQNGSLGGTYSYKNSLGCFNTDSYDAQGARRTGGKNGGKAAGTKNYKEGRGMWALTEEQWKVARKKMVRARGDTPYEGSKRFTEYGLQNEREYIISLIEDKVIGRKIEEKVNHIFKHNRNHHALRARYNQSWRYN